MLVSRVSLVVPAFQVSLDQMETKGTKGQMDFLDCLGDKDPEVRLETRGTKVPKVSATVEIQVLLDFLVYLDSRDQLGTRTLGPQDPSASQVHWVLLALRGSLEPLVRTADRAVLADLDSLGSGAPGGTTGHRGGPVVREKPASALRGPPGHGAPLVPRGQPGLQGSRV